MFNKETEYAIRSLVYIQFQNNNGVRPGTIEIANEIEAPQFFIAKILQRIVKLGILSSVKGKGGGFYFKEGSAPIRLSEVILHIEGGNALTGCGLGFKDCGFSTPCPLHDKYAPIREAMNTLVQHETIQSLAEKFIFRN